MIEFVSIPGVQIALVTTVLGAWTKIVLAAVRSVADAIRPHADVIDELQSDIHELRETRAAENTAMRNVEKRMDEISAKLDRLLERGK